jgi:hypothetical protein
MAAASFQYEALSTRSGIRVLTLLPATKFGAKIRCTIKEINLGDAQPVEYEALSYVWGNSEVNKVIYVCRAADSTQNFHPFKATWNLEAALRHLRCRDKERVIWIDAVWYVYSVSCLMISWSRRFGSKTTQSSSCSLKPV